LAYHAATRLAVDAVLLHVRRLAAESKGEERVDPLMLALWSVSWPTLVAYWGVIGWWLVAGRGPGGKLILLVQWWLPGNPVRWVRSRK
jgi:hypothetical protein